MGNARIIKQDMNFLEYPLWFQNIRAKRGFVWNDIEGYEYYAAHKVPSKTDYIFLLCLLRESQKNNWSAKLDLTRNYVISQSGLKKNKEWYNRLEDSLKRWQFVGIHFGGTFYDGKKYKTLNFGIIETWSIHQDTKRLHVRFNEDWILKIKNSTFYKMIDFDEIKKFRSPLTIRLYEILVKSFQKRLVWKIDSMKLAKKIPLKQQYPSQIVRAVIPAVNKIREKTDFNVYIELNKKKRGLIILIFKLIRNRQKVAEDKILPLQVLTEQKSYFPEKTLEVMTLIPFQYAESVKDIVLKICKEKGTEYIKKTIKYVNSMKPDNYPAYLTNLLKKDYVVNNLDLENRKCLHFQKTSQNCYNKCYGTCGAIWSNYQNNQSHMCHWCEKFKGSRTGVWK